MPTLLLVLVIAAAHVNYIECKAIVNDFAYACNLCRIPTNENAGSRPHCMHILPMQSYGLAAEEELSLGNLFAVQCAERVTRVDASSNALDTQSEIHDVRRIILQISTEESIFLQRVMSHLEPERHLFMGRKTPESRTELSADADAVAGTDSQRDEEWDSDKELISLVHARISHSEETALLLRTHLAEDASRELRAKESEKLAAIIARYNQAATVDESGLIAAQEFKTSAAVGGGVGATKLAEQGEV